MCYIKPMLKKLFLGLLALLFVLFGGLVVFVGYIFNNPDTIFNAINSVTNKIFEGEPHEENEEFFLQGIRRITINLKSTPIEIVTYQGSTLKISLSGKVPHFEKGPFIAQGAFGQDLQIDIHEPLASQWFQMNINGQDISKKSDSQLRVKVLLPETFTHEVVVSSNDGTVDLALSETSFYELELQSVNGKIDNSFKQKPTSNILPEDVGRIKIRTNFGAISVRNLN